MVKRATEAPLFEPHGASSAEDHLDWMFIGSVEGLVDSEQTPSGLGKQVRDLAAEYRAAKATLSARRAASLSAPSAAPLVPQPLAA